jgi:hypothetical protein
MDHYRYFTSDPTDSRFQATAVIENGELLIDIRAELEAGERSAVLQEADQLRKMLTHFFPHYTSIRTTWCYGENLAALNRAIASGATPEEAALKTMLGYQIALAGFSDVRILSLEGFPARYQRAALRFVRPETKI